MATSMRGSKGMGRGPGRTAMRTGASTAGFRGGLKGLGGSGTPNLNRGIGPGTGAPQRGIMKLGVGVAPSAPKKVANVRLGAPEPGMTAMTR